MVLNCDFVKKKKFEALEAEGYKVLYIDLSVMFRKSKPGHIIPSEIEKWVLPMPSKSELKAYLKRHAKDALAISFVQYLSNSAWMYSAIFTSQIPYVIAQNPNQPRLRKKGVDSKLIVEKTTKLVQRFNLRKLYEKPIQALEFAISKRQKRPALFALSYQASPNKSMAHLVGKKTDFIYTSSVDYKVALASKETSPIEGEYALFVDQFFCHHTDFKTHHIVHHFKAEQYYPQVNKFLKQFSEYHHLPIVVAGHPRRLGEYTDDFDFPIILNKTADLVRHAKVVLVHFSTAISFSVIFNKPMCFLDAKMFDNSTVRIELDRFADFFGADRIMIDKDYTTENAWTDPSSINYEKYLEQYLKPKEANDITLKACVLGLLK